MNRDETQSALAWHYHLQRGLYCRRQDEIRGARLFWDPTLADPEWNHVAAIDVSSGHVDSFLSEVAKRFVTLERDPVLVVDPTTRPKDLEQRLESRGWQPFFTHFWSFYPSASRAPKTTLAGVRPRQREFTIEPVRTAEQMRTFIEIFFVGFGAVDGDLDPGHVDALQQSFAAPPSDLEVVHLLGRWRGRAVAIGTMIHGRSEEGVVRRVSGFYNLVVRPEVRGQGLGDLLNRFRVEQALARGSQMIFLQTASSRLAHWHRRNGWEKGFVTKAYRRIIC